MIQAAFVVMVQILYEAVYILYSASIFGKSVHPIILSLVYV